jgi:hypothetical protein
MDKLNIVVLASSVLAMTGLGAYVYMNNNADNNMEHVTNEFSNDDNQDVEENEKSTKKSVTVKTKRRLNKASGTRRKR